MSKVLGEYRDQNKILSLKSKWGLNRTKREDKSIRVVTEKDVRTYSKCIKIGIVPIVKSRGKPWK